eukprot:jgi/Undpi1/9342/HiC_scaffold_26.g11800.m1
MNCLYGQYRCRQLSASSGSVNGKAEGEGCVVVITSGKGGVGKTTTAASLAYGLAEAGHRTCVIDFDIGLRNMDLHLGCERRVIFDFVNVIQEQCTLNQALIQDRRNPLLSLLAASQTKDKDALTLDGVTRVIRELQQSFAYVICDSPAGIESGARHAMYLADEAVIVTNPEVSSCRDSDKMVGFISSKSRRAEMGEAPVRQTLLVTPELCFFFREWHGGARAHSLHRLIFALDLNADPVRAESNDMLTLADIQELLGLEVLGLIPESKAVLTATNLGRPVIMSEEDDAALAYKDAVDRFLGKKVDLRFLTPKPVGLVSRLLSRG